ncbi:MAG: hypothetical protein IID45_10870 [Planctomycetes bacterium]|nr:hypothetical protein [Planctomycetota bacterium]
MKRVVFLFAGIWFLSWTAGCQCCGLTERYADLIDDVADYSPKFDRFYHAECDLNRIGKPDWCRSRFNRMLCRRACELTGCECCSAACAADAGTAATETPAGGEVPLLLPGGKSNRENKAPPAPGRLNEETAIWQIP